MIEAHFTKLYALWLREFKVFLREKSRLVASTFTPILWLFVIGSGLGAANPSTIPGVDYQLFIFPSRAIFSRQGSAEMSSAGVGDPNSRE